MAELTGSVGTVEAAFDLGDGGRVTLAALRYEYPEETSGSDANWVVGSVEFVHPSGFEVIAKLPVSWRAEELEQFAKELGQLVQGEVEEAVLEHLEEMVEMRIDRRSLNIRMGDRLFMALSGNNLDIESSELRRAWGEVESMVAAFPPRTRSS